MSEQGSFKKQTTTTKMQSETKADLMVILHWSTGVLRWEFVLKIYFHWLSAGLHAPMGKDLNVF